jgi:CBS domain-containing protein
MPTICPSCGHKNIEGVDECENCGADLRTVDLPKPVTKLEQTVMHLPLTALEFETVHAISPNTTVEDAIHTLNRQKLDILEIIEDEKLIGLLSVRDIVTRIGPDYRAKMSQPVRQFMTAKPETLPPDAPITFAINKMDVGGYRHVPVVQEGRMIGVVSSRDVIRHIVKHSREKVVVAGKTTSHGVESKPPVVREA